MMWWWKFLGWRYFTQHNRTLWYRGPFEQFEDWHDWLCKAEPEGEPDRVVVDIREYRKVLK